MKYIKHEYGLPTCVCLNVTDDCNLACKYCFVQQKPHYMSLEVGKKAIDFIIQNHREKKKYHVNPEELDVPNVTFFGGEPMLMFNRLIVPLVQYAEETYPNEITFDMTTNGTLLDDEKLLFLKEHHIHLLLSIDGNEEVQNCNRPCKNGTPSFPLVEKNIPKILEYFPNTTFRSTISQDTCEHLFDSYLYAIERGFNRIFFCPNAREDWSPENIEKLKIEIQKIFTYITLSFINGEIPIQCSPIDTTFRKILDHDLQVHYNNYNSLAPSRYPFRCGLGTTSVSISYDGKLFACQEQDSRDTNDYFYIGDIFNGINEEKHLKILEDYIKDEQLVCQNPSLCDGCKLRSACLEDFCPSVSHDRFNNFFIKPEIDCILAQQLMDCAITTMDILVNYDKSEVFQEYLNDLYQFYEKKEEHQ